MSAIDEIFLKNIASECLRKDCIMETTNEVIIEYSVSSFDDSLTWETDESYSVAISTVGKFQIFYYTRTK